MDIYCNDGCCPICSSNMIKNTSFFSKINMKCKNGCYRFFILKPTPKGNQIAHFFVFEIHSEFLFNSPCNPIKSFYECQIIEKINYWKENERYLLKLMESSKYKLV